MLKRFLLSYIMLCMLPFLLLGILVANLTSESIKDELVNAAEISMDESYRSINGILSSAREVSLTLMNEPDIQQQLQAVRQNGANRNEQLESLNTWLEAYPVYGSTGMKLCIYLEGAADSPVFDADMGKVVQGGFTDEMHRTAIAAPNRFYWYIQHSEGGSYLCQVKCIYSTEDWTTVLGIMTVSVDLDIMRSIAMAANTTGNRLYLTDENGVIEYPYYNYDHIPEEILTEGTNGVYELEDKLILVKRIESTGWRLIKSVKISEIDSHTSAIVRTILLVAALFALASLMAAVYFYRQISSPVQKLASHMKEVQTGDLTPIKTGPKTGEIGELYRSFNYMTERLHDQIEETYVAQIREKDADLRALQAQINPHFLYNTLDSINWLALRYQAHDISKMVLALSDMLRLSLNKGRNLLLISEELRQVDSYITLQKVRYSDCFTVEYQVDETVLNCRIIKMLMQPIVENAIVHGFEEIESGGRILITIRSEGEEIYFEVRNNGTRIDLEKMQKRMAGLDAEENARHGYGIRNVNERIKAFYGKQYGIQYSICGEYTVASFTLPKEGEQKYDDSYNR